MEKHKTFDEMKTLKGDKNNFLISYWLLTDSSDATQKTPHLVYGQYL